MVESNEIDRSLLALLDENIANAHKGNQVIAIGNAFSSNWNNSCWWHSLVSSKIVPTSLTNRTVPFLVPFHVI